MKYCRECGQPNDSKRGLSICEECLSEVRYQQAADYEAERVNREDRPWAERWQAYAKAMDELKAKA